MKILLKDFLLNDQRGLAFTWVAVMLFVLMGMSAFAVDLANIYGVRNELHNAADAGALAGARFLYNSDGTQVNSGANLLAYNAAQDNNAQSVSGIIPVDVNWSTGQNIGADVDVQRGHWSFGRGSLPRGFYPHDNLLPPDLWNRTTEELDADRTFVNAVRVVARRQASPTASFFARIFGVSNFELSKEAVAYIGFAGTIDPTEAEEPIAICAESILNGSGEYTCNIGRMLNSGSNPSTNNSAGWTNFTQPCDTANANQMRGLICAGGNPDSVTYGEGIGAVGGVQDVVYRDLRDCWIASALSHNAVDGLPNQPWELMLPVIDCPDNNVSNCSNLSGAVTVKVIFMSPEGGTPDVNDAPREMAGWSSTDPDGQARWDSFVSYFVLENTDGSPAPYAKKSIYFLPDCSYHEPTGRTGGENYGVLARIPVIVQ